MQDQVWGRADADRNPIEKCLEIQRSHSHSAGELNRAPTDRKFLLEIKLKVLETLSRLLGAHALSGRLFKWLHFEVIITDNFLMAN